MSHHHATRGRPILDECLQSIGQVGLLLLLTVAVDLLLYRNPVIINSVSPEVQAFLDTKGKRKAQAKSTITYTDLLDMLDSVEATVES